MKRENGAESRDERPLLTVENLRTTIHTKHKTVSAVDGIDFTVDRGETVCIVGESGSGKSVTCESLTGLIKQPPAEIVSGTVEFAGTEILSADDATRRSHRGSDIAHLFQNPQQSLDPVYTIGDQIVETIRIHEQVDRQTARLRGIELLRQVGIPRADSRIDVYPHELSGGMAQRVALAISLAADPTLLIADEPTTSVDVTVQARLIELFRDLTDSGMGLLFVTHDLRVVAALADRVLVMFGGTIVERGPVEQVFERPAHPYTQELFQSYGTIDHRTSRTTREDIPATGCRFRSECPYEIEACSERTQPPSYPVAAESDHVVSCVYYDGEHSPAPILESGSAVNHQTDMSNTDE
ncbi:ABC transporter ATP-binding protein [Natranaeroarchaeum aerophilus]|uniref:Nickel import system ATP-binding protein NikD n=1 Tax=Natranaeroarchaeum aerophilus TaxID=2917711 RepID=A0AAE3FTF2_9EURY|nr:ABC transporter ATP-binding protein [Natranaeroarchaeum aerophilus]MCL9814891.1 ABC transporter ATP-binding protein [Natranaeroarchaeum aerophilus]